MEVTSVTFFVEDPALKLKLPGGVAKAVQRGDIVKTARERISAMPEGLLQTLTAQEAANLLEYVSSLK